MQILRLAAQFKGDDSVAKIFAVNADNEVVMAGSIIFKDDDGHPPMIMTKVMKPGYTFEQLAKVSCAMTELAVSIINGTDAPSRIEV